MGCGCLLALGAVALPRVTLVVLWLFTDRLTLAFESFIVPVLGFLLLPYTTVFYALAYAPDVGVTGLGWFLVVLGFLTDLASLGGSREAKRRQPA